MKQKIDPEKLRDMIRSILPSRHRKPARIEKAARKRAYRRTIREKVRLEDAEETSVDLMRDVYLKDLVNARRSDKLNHFMPWCEVLTRHMSDKEALQYVRAILPTDVIGNHAYSHWEFHLKYRRRFEPPRRGRAEPSPRDVAISRLRNALEIDPSLQSRLNREIKAGRPGIERRRTLLGLHDIEAFIDEIDHREWDIMNRLIAEIEKGGREAALRLLDGTLPRSPAAGIDSRIIQTRYGIKRGRAHGIPRPKTALATRPAPTSPNVSTRDAESPSGRPKMNQAKTGCGGPDRVIISATATRTCPRSAARRSIRRSFP